VRPPLVHYQLTFPRDLSNTAVTAALAALSGAPHGSRFVFEVSATRAGLRHGLAVSQSHAELVLGSLRAAVPSLRLDATTPPAEPRGIRRLWQVVPRLGVLRSDDLAAISTNLLAGLFPLAAGELVRLRWHVRPGIRPRVEDSPEMRRTGRSQALRSKLAGPGLLAHGEVAVVAAVKPRRAQLLRRTGAALWSLGTPYGRLVPDPPLWARLTWLVGQRGRYLSSHELAAVIGWPVDGPDLPGLELGAAKRLAPSRQLACRGRVIGTTDFAGISRPVAITPSASTRGLYVLGPTGTGKTSLLKNLISDDLAAGRGLAVVETNGDLIRDLLDLIPDNRIQDVVLIDPTDRVAAVGFNPFVGSDDAALVADQLGELFQRLWKDYWGPRTGQLAHMGLLTLAQRSGSTLLDLPRLYLDPAFRQAVLTGLDDPVGLEPDWRWFDGLAPREQSTVVAPLLNKVRQFTARASVRAIMGQPSPATSMPAIMKGGKILLVNLPKGLIGAETATLLGCLILTALWQAATQRAALPLAARTPFGLYVDEVQDFAHAPIPWGEMFSQGRKYGLSLTVAHQNLEQLPKELREAILANARSQVLFALSAADARVMARHLEPAVTAADLQALEAHSVVARLALDNGGNARPVTLTTPPPPESTDSARQVRAASRRRYAQPRQDIEAALRRRAGSATETPVGRKPREAG
jgi:hypothetical protein